MESGDHLILGRLKSPNIIIKFFEIIFHYIDKQIKFVQRSDFGWYIDTCNYNVIHTWLATISVCRNFKWFRPIFLPLNFLCVKMATPPPSFLPDILALLSLRKMSYGLLNTIILGTYVSLILKIFGSHSRELKRIRLVSCVCWKLTTSFHCETRI